MIRRSAKFRAVISCLLAGVLVGCATPSPDWLSKPTGAYCATQLTKQCLQDFAQSAYTEATQKLVVERAGDAKAQGDQTGVSAGSVVQAPAQPASTPAVTAATSAGQGFEITQRQLADPDKNEAAQQERKPAKNPLEVDSKTALIDEASLPILGFGAGAIGLSPKDPDGFTPSEHLKQAISAGALLNRPAPSAPDILLALKDIPDVTLKAKVLFSALSLYGAGMTEDQADSLINELYSIDQSLYSDALLVKLPGLLKRGDLERAHALRKVLLRNDKSADRFSMLAYVASCYSMAGLREDALAIVHQAVGQGSELDLDDKKIISMAIKVGDGSYPMIQEFYDYRSDEVRLQAYQVIALVSRQLNRPDLARHAVGDAVRFIQKAATRVDRNRALGELLTLTPGLLGGG